MTLQHQEEPDLRWARRAFTCSVVFAFIFKLSLAAWLPVLGEEALWFLWGWQPDYGFYDHPPLTAWWLAALTTISDAPLWYRFPDVVLHILIGWGIVRVGSQYSPPGAYLAGAAYVLAPASLMHVVVTPDTPLLLFSFLAGIAFYLAVVRDRFVFFPAAGVLLGLAALSKYFAGLLALGLVVYWLLRPGVRLLLGLVTVALVSIAVFSINLHWNYFHCWDNYVINFVSRTAGSLQPVNALVYLAILVYLVTPPLILAWYRWWRNGGGTGQWLLFGVLFLVPAVLLALVSFVKSIGLHWLLGFYPFLFLASGACLSARQLRRVFKFMVVFSGAHVLVVAVFMALPLEFHQRWLKDKDYAALVATKYFDEAWSLIEGEVGERRLATSSFSTSSVLTHLSGRYFSVFGHGSYHGRQDDRLTDYRQWHGDDVLIVSRREPDLGFYRAFFERVGSRTVELRGAKIHLVMGDGFRYPRYKEHVIDVVRQRFYQIPEFLPMGGCEFLERYHDWTR